MKKIILKSQKVTFVGLLILSLVFALPNSALAAWVAEHDFDNVTSGGTGWSANWGGDVGTADGTFKQASTNSRRYDTSGADKLGSRTLTSAVTDGIVTIAMGADRADRENPLFYLFSGSTEAGKVRLVSNAGNEMVRAEIWNQGDTSWKTIGGAGNPVFNPRSDCGGGSACFVVIHISFDTNTDTYKARVSSGTLDSGTLDTGWTTDYSFTNAVASIDVVKTEDNFISVGDPVWFDSLAAGSEPAGAAAETDYSPFNVEMNNYIF